jgi:hypothetical protein
MNLGKLRPRPPEQRVARANYRRRVTSQASRS